MQCNGTQLTCRVTPAPPRPRHSHASVRGSSGPPHRPAVRCNLSRCNYLNAPRLNSAARPAPPSQRVVPRVHHQLHAAAARTTQASPLLQEDACRQERGAASWCRNLRISKQNVEICSAFHTAAIRHISWILFLHYSRDTRDVIYVPTCQKRGRNTR